MLVGVLVLDLFLHGCSSLKEKRRVIRSIKDRARSRFNVAVAEVDHQDLHQRGTLAFSSVSTSEDSLCKLFDRIVDLSEEILPGGVCENAREYLG